MLIFLTFLKLNVLKVTFLVIFYLRIYPEFSYII